jgi:hypothetical protein
VTVLDASVHVSGGAKPFGELTLAEVTARASELEGVVGFGPTARVATVARAWAELGRRMSAAGAATVAELDDATIDALAEGLWIAPPFLR